MTSARRVLVLAALAAVSGSVRANGTIDTSSSTITAGAAAQAGTVTIEECATPGPAPVHPSIGTAAELGTIGTLSDSIPAFPGGGSGADGAFHATSDTFLNGGTHEFTTFRIDSGVTVHAQGGVVIRTTGDADIDGLFKVEADNGDAIFECAGNLTVRALFANPLPGISTFSGLIKLDVAGALRLIDASTGGNSATTVMATQGGGDVDFIARGGSELEYGHCNMFAKQVRMRSASRLLVDGSSINVFGGGNIRLQAFGGDVEMRNSSLLCNGDLFGNADSPIVVDASAGIVTSVSFLLARNNEVRLTAFGGSIDLEGGYLRTMQSGDIRCRASGGVSVDGTDLQIVDANGTIEVSALGGDADLVAAPASPSSAFHNEGTGNVTIAASGGIAFGGNGNVKAANGDVTLRAYDGAITSAGICTFDAVSGVLDLGATEDVTAAAGGTIGLSGDTVRVVGGRIDLAANVTARTGAVTFLSQGALAGLGTMQSATDFTGTAIGGDITLDGSTITTEANANAASGDIRFRSFAGATGGRIAARNATIRSGDNGTASGDVELSIVTVPRPTVATYLLPTSVAVKLGAVRGAGIKASGAIGCPNGWLTAASPAAIPFTCDVGTRQIAGNLAPRPNGIDREFKADGVLLRVSPSPTGTSRGVFSLRIDGDLTGHVPADGLVAFRLQMDGRDFAGTVRLAGGKFKLGSVRGAVSEILYPLAVTASQKGAGKDSFAFTLGFSSSGLEADALGDLTIDFGGLSHTVSAADFTRSGNRFTAKSPPSAPGLSQVIIDFDAETVQVKAKALDLTALGAGNPVAVRIGVGFGGDLRSVDVTLSRKGTKLTW